MQHSIQCAARVDQAHHTTIERRSTMRYWDDGVEGVDECRWLWCEGMRKRLTGREKAGVEAAAAAAAVVTSPFGVTTWVAHQVGEVMEWKHVRSHDCTPMRVDPDTARGSYTRQRFCRDNQPSTTSVGWFASETVVALTWLRRHTTNNPET
ncbi:hypothetical protein EmuJ_000475000 [Echinococcus multilocularis]|uniref:Uncharacterized protein n=1 Tax=Echinococcus multilocularis TaxID=6211 RepID=A0A068XZ70_ECHMU|nr:hypothetical protein EmuJ_000475000 [Echinococcus multilocularis]